MRRLTRRQRMSAIALTVVALCFLTLDLGGGSLRDAHAGVRGTLGSLYRGTDSVLGPVRRWVQGVPAAGREQGTIDALREQNARLRGQLAALTEHDTRQARMAALADGPAAGHRLLGARVTAFGPGQGFDWTVTLDEGSRRGVRAGQTVTDGAGLVGRVLHVDPDSATVLLAADPGFGVGVRDVRSGELGVASGAGTDGFTFVPLRPGAHIRVGDTLQTGPNGATSFVAGVPVGTVTAVRTSADGTVRAAVAPTTSPTAVDVVAVLLDGPGAPGGPAAPAAAAASPPAGGHR